MGYVGKMAWSQTAGFPEPFRKVLMLKLGKSVRAPLALICGLPPTGEGFQAHPNWPCIPQSQTHLHVTLRGKVVYLVWTNFLHDPDQIRSICQVAIVHVE